MFIGMDTILKFKINVLYGLGSFSSLVLISGKQTRVEKEHDTPGYNLTIQRKLKKGMALTVLLTIIKTFK